MNLLPNNPDRKAYFELFNQDDIWIKAIRYLADKHKLAGDLMRGTRGSHIVYKVGNYWIKIMAPIFSKDMAFEIAGLETAEKKTSVATPEIIETGELENWLYIIVSNVPGQRIGDVWPKLKQNAKQNIAQQIAKVTLELQACIPKIGVNNRGDWNLFIKDRFENVTTHHKNKSLDSKWLDKLPSFLSEFQLQDFMTSNPVFLHADLTWDHFLLVDYETEPKVAGVIDFADCRLGHWEYDIPASAAFIFKSDKDALSNYILHMGFNTMNPNLSEKLMAWTCLHQYSDLNNYFKTEMTLVSPGDFSALAKMVYPLGSNGAPL
jgi:hygromycin-B 7''-O-kinase